MSNELYNGEVLRGSPQRTSSSGIITTAAAVTAMRPHQWLKNLLVFVPALAAHDIRGGLATAAIAFLSFSLCASAAYLFNDILDREHDRAHPRKRFRPLASGALSLAAGLRLALALLLAAGVVALALPAQFLLILLAYFALTCVYSLRLKQTLLIDIAALACLYGIRLVAGGAASGIALSPWLVVFSLFLFCCLATVKRCAELADRKASGGSTVLEGRAYCTNDLSALFAMATTTAFASVLVLALYVNSDTVRGLYAHPEWIWFAWIPFTLWISRVLLLTHRGRMHDDPVVFAATDRVSLTLAGACGFIVIASV